MDYEKTLEELKHMKVETGSFVCLGCGYEHNCSIHGCAILRDAVVCIEELKRVLQESEAARAELGRRLAAAQKMNAELTDAQAVMVREFEAKLEELERVKAERSWISVKDRLPERTVPPHDVLVYHDLGCGMFVDRAWYSYEKRRWISVLGMKLKVTHWMPLPEPPEKEM